MFRISGRKYRLCDGQTRRSFLQAGLMGVGGLTLADLLRAENAEKMQSANPSQKRPGAIIHIHLDGGPPQMDTIDMKPDGPSETRGEFSTIKTKIKGFQVCELMPRIASIANQMAFVRSVTGSAGKHDAFQCQSGFNEKELASVGGWPAMGCVVGRKLGKPTDPVPAFVDLMQGRGHVRNSARPGFLGPAYTPFRPDISKMFRRPLEDGMKIELKRLGAGHATGLKLIGDLDERRLKDRRSLLNALDRVKRDMDRSGQMDAMDRFSQQAASILTSGKFAEALDLSKEDPKTVAKYTYGQKQVGHQNTTSEGPEAGRKLLIARRMIEAGVRVVSVSISDFDTHTRNFDRMRQLMPITDNAIFALITDLQSRGLLDTTTVIAWGEFGRTPKVNAKAGRDHWPRVSNAILAGGGLKVGQVIGKTDKYAGEVTDSPVSFQDIVATLYNRLGMDSRAETIVDPSGRPHYLTPGGSVVRQLI